MKVLLLCYRGNPFCGGQGIYIYNLSMQLAKLGVSVDVITGPPYPDSMDDWANDYRLDNLNMWAINTKDIPYEKLIRAFSPWNFVDYVLTRLHIFPEMQTFSMRAFFYLKKLLKTKSYDIIHDVNSIGWGLIPMKYFGIPIITTIHHPLTKDREADLMMGRTFWNKIATMLFYPIIMQKIVINRLEKVITSFNEGVGELNRAFGLNEKKITVVYNGMDTDAFQNTGEKRELSRILFVGNTEDYKKGLIYLFEAMTMLPENIRLLIVDDGPPKKLTASEMIKKFKLEERVEFTGKVDLEILVSLYSKAPLVVMSSLFEGFGLPAVEAMSCKTPVVVTRAGALDEVVNDECGIKVPMKNPKAISDAIMKLLKDADLRKKMGEAGRIRAVENFSWTSCAKNTLTVYESVIKEYRGKL